MLYARIPTAKPKVAKTIAPHNVPNTKATAVEKVRLYISMYL